MVLVSWAAGWPKIDWLEGGAEAVARVAMGNNDARPQITISILWCRIFIAVLRDIACRNTLNNTSSNSVPHRLLLQRGFCIKQNGARLPKGSMRLRFGRCVNIDFA